MYEEKTETPALLDLDKIFKNKAPGIYKKTPRFVINYLKKKTHVDELNEILTVYKDKQGVDFMESVVGYFDLTLNVEGLDALLTNKRYVFVSNHPLGGLDGICLSTIIGGKFDKKIKYLVNDLLYFIKNLQPIFIPINKHGSQSKNKTQAINEAYLSDDQIITFPAGLCSRKTKDGIYDLEWKKSFIQKAVESKRDIVPIHFEARNSNFFYRFANIRESLGIKFNLEMVFLSDEMFKNKHKTFNIIFGKPIPYEYFNSSKNVQNWADEVKRISYSLKPSGNDSRQ